MNDAKLSEITETIKRGIKRDLALPYYVGVSCYHQKDDRAGVHRIAVRLVDIQENKRIGDFTVIVTPNASVFRDVMGKVLFKEGRKT